METESTSGTLATESATIPASAAPVWTNCSVCRMFSPNTSFGRSASQIPAFLSACSAARPYGAWTGFAIATCLTRESTRLRRSVSFGPNTLAVARTMRPCAYSVRVSRSSTPSAAKASTNDLSAAKKTSAGPPWRICCAKFPVEPKTSVTRAPVACSKRGAISLKAKVRSAAANTVRDGGLAASVERVPRTSHVSARTIDREQRIIPPILSMLARVALLDRGQGPVHEEDQHEEQQRERDGDLEVPLAGLEHHRRRQRARLPLDVPADHHRGADLRDDAAEAGHDRGEHGQARLAQHHPHHLGPRGAERQELEPELARHLPDGGERDAGHDRRSDDGLRDHDGRRRIQDLPFAQRAAAPKEERHEEPDDDGRQAHARVHGAHDEPAPGKARERQRRAGRDAQGQRDQRRAPRDLEREPENPPDLTVGADDEGDRLPDAAPQKVHRATSVLESPQEDTHG